MQNQPTKLPIQMRPVDSSQLKEVGFDPASGTLAIRFHAKKGPGSLYQYRGVPQDVFDGLVDADADPEKSVGTFFGENIKGKGKEPLFPFDRIVETEETPA